MNETAVTVQRVSRALPGFLFPRAQLFGSRRQRGWIVQREGAAVAVRYVPAAGQHPANVQQILLAASARLEARGMRPALRETERGPALIVGR